MCPYFMCPYFLVVAVLLSMVLRQVDAPLTKNLRDGPLPALDTIRNADTPVAAAGKGKPGKLGTAVLDHCDTVKVPERILRHAEMPPEDTREERFHKRIET